MAIQYDPSVIVSYARRLYAKSLTTIVLHVLAATALAALPFTVGKLYFSASWQYATPIPLAALLGYLVGSERSFALRLQAQTALCQVQIELNTRAAGRS